MKLGSSTKFLAGMAFAVAMVFIPAGAHAATVSVRYNNSLSHNLNSLTVGTTTYTDAVCDDDRDNVSNGETWNANVETFGTNGAITDSFFGSGGTQQKYDEAVYLYSLMTGVNQSSSSAIQNAIWALFDTNDSTNTWDTAANTWWNNHDNVGFDFSGYDMITPANCTVGRNCAQEFIVYTPPASTPEPGSLVLFGSGMLGLAGLLRRKIFKA